MAERHQQPKPLGDAYVLEQLLPSTSCLAHRFRYSGFWIFSMSQTPRMKITFGISNVVALAVFSSSATSSMLSFLSSVEGFCERHTETVGQRQTLALLWLVFALVLIDCFV